MSAPPARAPAASLPDHPCGERLFENLRRHLQVRALKLWAATPAGDVLLHASGDGPVAASYPLRSTGRVIGRIEISSPTLRTVSDLLALLPGIALVVETLEDMQESAPL